MFCIRGNQHVDCMSATVSEVFMKYQKFLRSLSYLEEKKNQHSIENKKSKPAN